MLIALLPPCLLTAFILLITGCTTAITQPDNKYAENFKKIEPQKTIVISPIQTNDKIIIKGKAAIEQELYSQLQQMGFRVQLLDQKKYETVWHNSIEKAGGIYDPVTGQPKSKEYGLAIQFLSEAISKQSNYDILLMPSVFYKQVEIKGKAASWDGVIRTYRTVGSYADYSFKGTTYALSLRLNAFTLNGSWLSSTYGGILLPYLANMKEVKTLLDENAFEDRQEIQEGVHITIAGLMSDKSAVTGK